MSSRALRKAQREREEQERLRKLDVNGDVEVEEDEMQVQSTKKSAFELLGEQDEAEDDDDDDAAVADDEHKEDKGAQVDAKAKSASKKKKKKKKNKGKAKVIDRAVNQTTPKNEDDGLDEIDKALLQLSKNGDAVLSASTTAGVNAETDEASKLLAVDSSHLHAQNEMRRLFGRAALEQDDDDAPPEAAAGGNRRQQRRVQQVGLAQALRMQQPGTKHRNLTAMALRRNLFVQGSEEWPSATSGGLGMEVEEKRADGTILYRFVHNSLYQDVQRQFAIAVASMNPDRLILMLQQNPCHIATLLQVSEIAKHDRTFSDARDLLEKALFTFGRTVHSTFAKALAAGNARLDFRRPQNREFWLASWRYMQNLSMRATWRTVYEWSKMLLQLSPEEDPYAMWLVLDQYALRARQDLDFLNLSRSALFKKHVESMPHVQLSQGLAEYRAGNKSKGQQALFSAVGHHPHVVARLMQELNLDPPPAVWGKEPRTEKERLYAELYATRAKDLWSTPEASALLLEVASALPPDTPRREADVTDEILENEARHVLLSETPTLIALIPRQFTERLQSSSDPLPPTDTFEPAQNTFPFSRGQVSQAAVEAEFAALYDRIQSGHADNFGDPLTDDGTDETDDDDS